MPSKKPFVRRFGQVDFDSMTALSAADDADIFVTRRGAFGANRTVTRAQIAAGGGGVPDPLLLNDGAVGAPTYSFTSDTDTGVFLPALNQLGFAANGVEIARAQGVVGANQFIIAPGVVQNNAAFPSLAFGVGGNTGFYESTDNVLHVAINGTSRFIWAVDIFSGALVTAAALRDVIPTATVPGHTFIGDLDTGIGHPGLDEMSLIAGQIEGLRITEVAGLITIPTFGPILTPDGTNLAPSYSFAGDPDTGIYTGFTNVLDVTLGGVRSWTFQQNKFNSQAAGGPQLLFETSTTTNPTVCANVQSDNTGVGGLDEKLTLIANGVDCINVAEAAGARQVGFYVTTAISLQTGVAVTDVAIHAALVNLGLITA